QRVAEAKIRAHLGGVDHQLRAAAERHERPEHLLHALDAKFGGGLLLRLGQSFWRDRGKAILRPRGGGQRQQQTPQGREDGWSVGHQGLLRASVQSDATRIIVDDRAQVPSDAMRDPCGSRYNCVSMAISRWLAVIPTGGELMRPPGGCPKIPSTCPSSWRKSAEG